MQLNDSETIDMSGAQCPMCGSFGHIPELTEQEELRLQYTGRLPVLRTKQFDCRKCQKPFYVNKANVGMMLVEMGDKIIISGEGKLPRVLIDDAGNYRLKPYLDHLSIEDLYPGLIVSVNPRTREVVNQSDNLLS
jgi:hypothetical protein